MRRILSIDGGGVKGVFATTFLAAIEDELDGPIGRYFDLIAGTSIGGIIAIGLAMGFPARQLNDLFVVNGPSIFYQKSNHLLSGFARLVRVCKHVVVGSKYSNEKLKEFLTDLLADKLIGNAITRLLVPAFNPSSNSVYVYKTAHNKRLTTDYKELALDAALATASAPTYFPAHITNRGIGLVDGGVWANNPAGIAVVEGISVLGWRPDEIKLLSVGCTEDVIKTKSELSLRDLKHVLSLFQLGQSHGSMGIAKLLLGDTHDRASVYRICPKVPSGEFDLDDVTSIPKLVGLGNSEVREQKPILKPHFFTGKAEEFHPAHNL